MRAIALASAAAGLAALATGARAETACADLAKTALPHAQVTAATTETVGKGQACRIQVTARPTDDSDIRIEVWIPIGDAWNGRSVQIGNGGFAGQIPGQLKFAASQGYAAAGTDDGHQRANLTDASWALGHPEKFVDFAWRALKQSTDVTHALIAAQKGRAPEKAYFYGCSDGGREALMEAQRFPKDFDGIVAGAPAYDMSHLFALGAAIQQALAKPGGYLGPDQRALLQSAALAKCGGEAFIRDPASCAFDPAALKCRPGDDPAKCLTPAQLVTAQVIYGGAKDPRNGRLLNVGFSPGAEAQPGSWSTWITGPSEDKRAGALNFLFSSNAFKYFAFGDPSFDLLKLDLGAQFERGLQNTRVLDSADPDLKAFRDHGGKLVNYHGWNDPAIPPRASILYYERMSHATGRADDFYRVYLVPGMLHCGGGPGPSNVDWLAVLDGWAREGKRPEAITATGAAGASQTLCPYPAVASKAGACAAPAKR
jgi:feruloyl esterase